MFAPLTVCLYHFSYVIHTSQSPVLTHSSKGTFITIPRTHTLTELGSARPANRYRAQLQTICHLKNTQINRKSQS